MAERRRILLADDHALVRGGLRQLLADQLPQTDFVEVGSLDEALAALDLMPEIALAILDLDMPGMMGAESLRRLRERRPALRVVVLSASETRDHMLRALAAGAHGYLTKSMANAALVDALKAVLAGTVYVPPQLAEAPSEPPVGPPSLTERQRQVLRLVVDGCSNKEIARRLGVAEGTVKMHLASLFRGLRVKNRAQAVARAGTLKL